MDCLDIALTSWLTAYKMSWQITCPRYTTLPVMAWIRCFSSLHRRLSSGWSSGGSFPTPGVYVDLQLAVLYRSSRDSVHFSWVMVTVPFAPSRVTPIPSTSDTSPMSVIEKRLISFGLIRLSIKRSFPSNRMLATHRVRTESMPRFEM